MYHNVPGLECHVHMVKHCAITQEPLIKIDFSWYQWFFNGTFQLNWVYGFVVLVMTPLPPNLYGAVIPFDGIPDPPPSKKN